MNTEVKSNIDLKQPSQDLFRYWLQRQFTDRCKKNPRYSLRAFAKLLATDPSSLSQILSGKRIISIKIQEKICATLNAFPHEYSLLGLKQSNSRTNETSDEFLQLNLDVFSVISDWYNYAILELTYVQGFRSDAAWIARKLSITVQEAKSSIERLIRLGLLESSEGTLVKKNARITNANAMKMGSAHKELQRQILNLAVKSIDECPKEKKDITSMTMAIDPSKIDQARLMIQKFRRDICEFLTDQNQKQVYHLAIQLFPVSTGEEEQ